MPLKHEAAVCHDARGRITGHRAQLGGFEGLGPTPRAALADLQASIERHDHPVFRSTSDGAIWIAFDLGGSWLYTILRPRADGYAEGGSTMGPIGKRECVAAMDRHRLAYQRDLDEVAAVRVLAAWLAPAATDDCAIAAE